jgi:hypothetical protein
MRNARVYCPPFVERPRAAGEFHFRIVSGPLACSAAGEETCALDVDCTDLTHACRRRERGTLPPHSRRGAAEERTRRQHHRPRCAQGADHLRYRAAPGACPANPRLRQGAAPADRGDRQAKFIDKAHRDYARGAADYYLETRLRASPAEQDKYCKPLKA